MKLNELATIILSLHEQPISRIRFSKVIYFAHKELVRKGIMQIENIKYLRLPLGPVPDDLIMLTTANPEIKITNVQTNLFYATEEFYLESKQTNIDPAVSSAITKILQLLEKYSTPELVKASYDPSWQAHQNGEAYYITAADLRNTFPVPHIHLKIRIRRQPNSNHLGALQAHLIRGMLRDIVKESTDLEYPDEDDSKTAKSGDSTQLPKHTDNPETAKSVDDAQSPKKGQR